MTKKKGRVSIILPTYNREIFLEAAIVQILDSKYPDKELVVVDDCSTDKTKEILKKFGSYIKVVSLEENSGTVSIPRNIGISHSTGEYICHADDDVVSLPDKFQDLVSCIEADSNNILSYGDRIDQYGDGQRLIEIKDWNPLAGTGVDNSQILYKSKVYSQIGFCYVYRACDWELAKLIFPLGNFAYINKPVSIYLWHGDNRSIKTNGLYSSMQIEGEKIDKFSKYINKDYFNHFLI